MSISSTSNTLSSPSSSASSAHSSGPQSASIRASPFSSSSSSSVATSPTLDCDRPTLGSEADDDEKIFNNSHERVTMRANENDSHKLQGQKHAEEKTSITNNYHDKKGDKVEETISVKQTTKFESTGASVSDSCHSVLRVTATTTSASRGISNSSGNAASQRANSKASVVKLECAISAPATVGPNVLKKEVPPLKTTTTTTKTKSNVSLSKIKTSVASQQQQQQQQQSSINKVRLSTKLETTCNILSKSPASSSTGGNKSSALSVSAAASSSSSSASRPDLVASSSTQNTNQVINFKTLPLLMNHNHHYQISAQTLANLTTSGINSTSATRTTNHSNTSQTSANKSNKLHSTFNGHQHAPTTTAATTTTTATTTATANGPLISTLSPQIILSQIITANPTQRSSDHHHHQFHHSAVANANLEGIQFCLNTTATTSQAGTNVLKVQQTAATNATLNSNNSDSKQGNCFNISEQTRSESSRTKVKVHSQQASNKSSIETNSTGSPSSLAHDGSGNFCAGNTNVAAARLLDLGKKLLEASREGKLDQVRHLVEDSGAPFTSDWLGTTALHLAAQGGYPDIAEVLVRAGVNRDARTKLERTALHLAAQSGSLQIVDLLLTNGSDVNACDMLRMTPLHWAVERGHVYVAKRLLISGANATLSNKFLLTPVDIAREVGSREMIDLFKVQTWTGASDVKDEQQNFGAFCNMPDVSLNESQDFLDTDYRLVPAPLDSATNSRGASIELDNEESACMDLVGLEWSKFEFDPDLFLPNESDEDHKVDFLMKVVEDLKKENQLLRQQVEQLSTVDEASSP